MKFIFQLLGNLTFFFLYSSIGLQLVRTESEFLDYSDLHTISWSNFAETILFFIIISALSVLTTYSFSYTFQKRKKQRIPKANVEGPDISPEVTVEDKDNQPERIIDLLTDSSNKIIREDSKIEKTLRPRAKKSGKKKIVKKKQ